MEARYSVVSSAPAATVAGFFVGREPVLRGPVGADARRQRAAASQASARGCGGARQAIGQLAARWKQEHRSQDTLRRRFGGSSAVALRLRQPQEGLFHQPARPPADCGLRLLVAGQLPRLATEPVAMSSSRSAIEASPVAANGFSSGFSAYFNRSAGLTWSIFTWPIVQLPKRRSAISS